MSPGRVPLRTAFENPSSKHAYVRRLFSTIADRYDLITVLLSFGLDRGWKTRVADLAGPLEGKHALDLACGTGDITFSIHDRGACAVGLDITHRMVELARNKTRRSSLHPAPRTPHPVFVVGDMSTLPIPNQQFDVVTTGYGLRNVPVIETALTEIHRVLRPGGVLVSLDFNRPAYRVVRGLYLAYLTAVGSALGLVLHRDPDTYRYIPESIRRYPGAASVCDMMRRAGFTRAEWIPILGGLMAIHVARN